MPRRRDPQDLLERARQMEAEARTIRAEAERLRRERETKENQQVGVALRRCWKKGWNGVVFDDVVEAANGVFGEPPVDWEGEGGRTDAAGGEDGAEGKVKDWHQTATHGVPGDLFGERGGPSHGGS
ncbi:MAG: hypothetical protein P1P84_15370 [Deferrisomatales bacterium]|nr:hypothetical protein [Deferrisomatales bacterium]